MEALADADARDEAMEKDADVDEGSMSAAANEGVAVAVTVVVTVSVCVALADIDCESGDTSWLSATASGTKTRVTLCGGASRELRVAEGTSSSLTVLALVILSVFPSSSPFHHMGLTTPVVAL